MDRWHPYITREPVTIEPPTAPEVRVRLLHLARWLEQRRPDGSQWIEQFNLAEIDKMIAILKGCGEALAR